MTSEPGQGVLSILDQLVDRIKSSRPLRTNGKPLTEGFVYSQLVLGQPIEPHDYMNAWSPSGGTVQDTVGTAPPAGGTAPAPDPNVPNAIHAAFMTTQLVDNMIMVTDDDSWLEYKGGGRHISFAYDGIINAMQPTPMPPISPDVQKQIDDSKKVLYDMDSDGNILGKSKMYKTYAKNAAAYAKAKMDYADAQAAALANPAKANLWPQDSVYYQQQVDDAYDTLKTEGAEVIERALDVIESVGVSLQDRMIAKARKVYDAWNLGLAGVPITTPYSYVTPSGWSDPSDDADGWEHLVVTQSTYQHQTQNHYRGKTEEDTSSNSQSGSAGVGVFLGFVNVAGGGSAGSSQSSASNSWQYSNENSFHNTATNLTIDIEYALCDINRPWYIGDLFFMKNWYLVNNPKNAVSDGTIQNQIMNETALLPMIPVQFLAIRNVTISSDNWGSDGDTISNIVDTSSSNSSSSNASGSAGVSFGFVNFGGSYSRSDTKGHAQSDAQNDGSSNFTTYWDGQSLSIHGTQIIAWLSDVLPPCAPLDDPNLKK